jgi:MraZ protein
VVKSAYLCKLVGKTVFQGSSALTLDAKGRINIPTRHRDALLEQAGGCLTLTRHPDGCLLVYPRPEWVKKREQIAAFPMQARALQRLLLGNAQDAEIDATGRILVAPELRLAVGLSREVMLLGMGSHFEMWDTAALAAREAADLSQSMGEVLNQFSF